MPKQIICVKQAEYRTNSPGAVFRIEHTNYNRTDVLLLDATQFVQALDDDAAHALLDNMSRELVANWLLGNP